MAPSSQAVNPGWPQTPLILQSEPPKGWDYWLCALEASSRWEPGRALEDPCQSTGWELTFCTGDTAPFLDLGTWGMTQKEPAPLCSVCLSHVLPSVRSEAPPSPLHSFFSSSMRSEIGTEIHLPRSWGQGLMTGLHGWPGDRSVAAVGVGLVRALCGWLEEKWEPSPPSLPHPSRVSWAPSRAGSFQGCLLPGLASCMGSFSFGELPGPFQLCFLAAILVPKVALWVFGISMTFPTAELPRNDTLIGAVRAGSCPRPLFSLVPHYMGWG